MISFEGPLMLVKLAVVAFVAIRLASCMIGIVIGLIFGFDEFPEGRV